MSGELDCDKSLASLLCGCRRRLGGPEQHGVSQQGSDIKAYTDPALIKHTSTNTLFLRKACCASLHKIFAEGGPFKLQSVHNRATERLWVAGVGEQEEKHVIEWLTPYQVIMPPAMLSCVWPVFPYEL